MPHISEGKTQKPAEKECYRNHFQAYLLSLKYSKNIEINRYISKLTCRELKTFKSIMMLKYEKNKNQNTQDCQILLHSARLEGFLDIITFNLKREKDMI